MDIRKDWRKLLRYLIPALLVLVVSIAGCTEENPEDVDVGSDDLGTADAVIVIEKLDFVPSEIVVAPGATVAWVNTDKVDHTVTSGVRDAPDDLFNETLVAGERFEYVFDEPGEYEYFCSLHPGMEGIVFVRE